MQRREDIQIPCHNDIMAGWLYPAVSPRGSSAKKGPAIVLAHGLGGVKEMRLDAYAEKFSSLGYICVVFDYRNSGSSTGKPAGLVHVPRQLEDWRVAIEYTRKLENVDLTRIGIFGTSFGGGNVIRVAAADPSIKAVISQCPFTDGFHSTLTVGWKVLPSLVYLALKDLLFGTDDDPVTVPLIGEPNSVALMNAHDCLSGCEKLIPADYNHPRVIPARFALEIPWERPGSYAKTVKAPILFAICGLDTVAPPKPTLAWAKTAPNATIKWYDGMGHFDIYVGEAFERASADYVEFLQKNLPVTA